MVNGLNLFCAFPPTFGTQTPFSHRSNTDLQCTLNTGITLTVQSSGFGLDCNTVTPHSNQDIVGCRGQAGRLESVRGSLRSLKAALTDGDAESALELVLAVVEEGTEDEGQRERQQLLL